MKQLDFDSQMTLSLSAFLEIIKSQFDEVIAYHSYTIEAEVKAIKQNRSFYYIDLVEIQNGKIIDSTRANIFNPTVMQSFQRQLGILDVQDLVWKKLMLEVRPSFHKTYNFSVNILKIHAEFTLWILEKQKQDTIKYLQKLWVFDSNHLTQLGSPSFHIAVITWEKSEWFRDFQTIVKESGYNLKITQYTSLVHWEKASIEVLQKLQSIQKDIKNWAEYNWVAIIRGGWGSEWMNWANDRMLCAYACSMQVPIISAVGHTVDQSVLDMIAKYDCKTPSEAAYVLIDIYEKYAEQVRETYEYIQDTIFNCIEDYTTELEFHKKEINYQLSHHTQAMQKQLDWLIIEKKIHFRVQILSQELKNLHSKIQYLDPQKILSYGYGYFTDSDWNIQKKLTKWNAYTLIMKDISYQIEVKK